MTHPSSPQAPMTAEDLRVLGMKFAGGALTIPETADLFRHIDALTARVAELELTLADHATYGCRLQAERTRAEHCAEVAARRAVEIEHLKAELAAARKVEDGEVEEALGWLDKPQLYPSGRIKKIAALVRQLYAALKEAERTNKRLTTDISALRGADQ